MTQPKKLIEVAMPVKEISAESVRDKSIRHGHISTLHLWWARRPLPVCRAVVFASLVPDPLDENCPPSFRDAVEKLLGAKANLSDPYKPYDNIPYTAVVDPLEDNLRNRLMMFIGKFSDTFIADTKTGKTTAAKYKLSDASLIKWDNKNDEKIIGKARKLIWVAFNADAGTRGNGDAEKKTADELLNDFDEHYKAIKDAEKALYDTEDRHIESDDVNSKQAKLDEAIETFLEKMPRVFDPFAGGGAIPLEASRLGCRSYGNDINPVAHIIQKGSLEFPQKYGKPISYSKDEFIKLYGTQAFDEISNENIEYAGDKAVRVNIENRLSFDVEFYAKKLLKMAEDEIGEYYPANEKGEKPIAYYWVRVGTCSNPSCRAEVPLLKGFNLVNKKGKQIHLEPIIENTHIEFKIKHGKSKEDGWIARGNMSCPCCGNTTDVKSLKEQFKNKETSEKILAVMWNGKNGKDYKQPVAEEIAILSEVPTNIERPSEPMPVKYTQALPSCTWGLKRWGDMFSSRQIMAMQNLVQKLEEIKPEIGIQTSYGKAVATYLAMFINRMATRITSYGLFNSTAETIEHPFGKQAIPMVFDYPEANPFSEFGGGGLSQINWIRKYIETESYSSFSGILQNASSGEKEQFSKKSISAVVTDPPYYDAIAYADLSDFFYVWLKRTLGNVFPKNFSTPQTPKAEECTALKHHHENNYDVAKKHFENKLLEIFDAIEHQTSDVVSIMFAHQTTEAWTTLCNSILGARLNITGSWAIDTERSGAGVKAKQAFLSSSVTVSCKPAQRQGFGDYKDVKKAIEKTVIERV